MSREINSKRTKGYVFGGKCPNCSFILLQSVDRCIEGCLHCFYTFSKKDKNLTDNTIKKNWSIICKDHTEDSLFKLKSSLNEEALILYSEEESEINKLTIPSFWPSISGNSAKTFQKIKEFCVPKDPEEIKIDKELLFLKDCVCSGFELLHVGCSCGYSKN